VPARVCAGVAHRPERQGLDQQCIPVAIHRDALQQQIVAALFPFRPQLFAGTAEKSNLSLLPGFVERYLVHETQHQHLIGHAVLHDGRRKSVRIFAKIHLRIHIEKIYILTAIPWDCKYPFNSGIAISLKWKMLAAKAASADPGPRISAKCAGVPPPPEAMTGTGKLVAS